MQMRYDMKIKGSWQSNIIDMGMEWKCTVENDTQTLSMEGTGIWDIINENGEVVSLWYGGFVNNKKKLCFITVLSI